MQYIPEANAPRHQANPAPSHPKQADMALANLFVPSLFFIFYPVKASCLLTHFVVLWKTVSFMKC